MQKPNLLLLHGALGSKDQFVAFKELLSESFTVYDLNFSGHGGSEAGEGIFSIDDFSDDVIRFLEENAIEKTHVFGYSMGGYVALNLAFRQYAGIDKIFTLATKFDWTEASAAREVKFLDPDVILEKVPKFATALSERHGAQNWKSVLEKTAGMMLALGGGKALSMNDLSSIKNPVTIAVGSLDNMVTTDESKKAADALPDSKFLILEDVKHPIEKVDPVVLKPYLESFFLS